MNDEYDDANSQFEASKLECDRLIEHLKPFFAKHDYQTLIFMAASIIDTIARETKKPSDVLIIGFQAALSALSRMGDIVAKFGPMPPVVEREERMQRLPHDDVMMLATESIATAAFMALDSFKLPPESQVTVMSRVVTLESHWLVERFGVPLGRLFAEIRRAIESFAASGTEPDSGDAETPKTRN